MTHLIKSAAVHSKCRADQRRRATRPQVGSHGRDTLGIFRVHQFEKVEQFCVTGAQHRCMYARVRV